MMDARMIRAVIMRLTGVTDVGVQLEEVAPASGLHLMRLRFYGAAFWADSHWFFRNNDWMPVVARLVGDNWANWPNPKLA